MMPAEGPSSPPSDLTRGMKPASIGHGPQPVSSSGAPNKSMAGTNVPKVKRNR